MSEIVENYIKEVLEKYNSGQAREHAYRPPLENLFRRISGLRVINDPKRSEYGSPDFVFLNGKITVAYAEVKDVNISLDEIEDSEQLIRYFGYANLILTNCLEFRFYRNGEKYGEPIKIAEIKEGRIIPKENNFKLAEDTIGEFVKESREPIKSGEVLAKVMAGKARRIRDNIRIFLSLEEDIKNKELLDIYKAIKERLLPDMDYEKFSDMYAQTVVYGLFVARYYDKTPEDFSRREAIDLIPASNPFLRRFFDHIAGVSFDRRIEIIVNELCEEFTNSDVNAIIHNYYKVKKDFNRDPIIHFYEDFLKEYDPKERVKLGVFYTPLPVVKFIVNSVDEILQKEFSLDGLKDSSKVEIQKELEGKKIKQLIHRVQILDPATGTGTFLNEVISHIRGSFTGQEGRWPKYVKDDLLPRLHGFELMVASYTIAHLKLSISIKESGAEIGDERLGIYLTNSLEKGRENGRDLFSFGLAGAITEESSIASIVKNKLPTMVILGNPPYSGESMNPNYTDNDVYKVEPGTNRNLQERNSKWINDDYVKFIRLAESLIEKTGEGIVGMITAHGYLDNPTFRGMRYHLMQTFDSIYVFDLHGNANKKEVGENGEPDKNVFDIKTGVSIILAVKKKSKKKELGNVFRFDISGSREKKFEFLRNNSFKTIKWKKVQVSEPNYEFVIRDNKLREEYNKGFSVNELFIKNSVGIVTAKDAVFIAKDKKTLEKQIKDYLEKNNKKDLFDDSKIIDISYRPFDDRYIYYDTNLIERPRQELMNNFRILNNLGIVILRQVKAGQVYQHVLVSKNITESTYVSNKTSEIGYVFPLYRYEDYYIGETNNIHVNMVPNIDPKISGEISEKINIPYNNFPEYIKNNKEQIIPEDIFNYIYAYLHSLSYREKYGEFLKIDFPRVPYPKNKEQFFNLVQLGNKLKGLHLLEDSVALKPITTYSISGNDVVESIKYIDGNVYINKEQYFGSVPEDVWNFYIGGYQPAQKWLKDRKGNSLTSEEISHYQKIIASLSKTIKIMKEVDFIVLN